MEVKERLLMTFKTAGDKKVSISVDDPKEGLTEEEIVECMTVMLAKNIFSIAGDNLADLVDAKIVQTNTQEFDLIV